MPPQLRQLYTLTDRVELGLDSIVKLALVAFLAVSSFGVASAEGPADDKVIAQAAYRDGTRLYDIADFKAALESFKKAYLHYEDPAFLFNIAQCYRQLGNAPEAVRFYKTYLRKLPDSPNTAEVRHLIASLESAAPRQSSAPESAPPATATALSPATPDTAPSPASTSAPGHSSSTLVSAPAATATKSASKSTAKKWWVWTIVGVVAAGAATGVALGITQSRSSEQQLPTVHVP